MAVNRTFIREQVRDVLLQRVGSGESAPKDRIVEWKLAGGALRTRCARLRQEAEAVLRAAQQRDYAAYQRQNQGFHRTIVAAAGNKALMRLWDTLAYEVRAQAIMEYITTADPVSIARDHHSVVAAGTPAPV